MLANWVKQAVTAGGTSNLTLGSADSGFIDLNIAIGQGPRFPYVIEDGSNRESGIGYLSASTTLVRETVQAVLSSGVYDNSSPAPINVTTTAKVMISVAADHSSCSQPYLALSPTGLDAQIGSSTWSGGNTYSLTANTLVVAPFYLPMPAWVTGLGLYVNTAGAGSAVAGIYETTSRDTIRKIVQINGEISVSTTGSKSASFLSGIKLTPGYYSMALNTNIAFTVRSGGLSSLGDMSFGDPAMANMCSRVNTSFGYSGTLPETIGSSDVSNNSSQVPRVWMVSP